MSQSAHMDLYYEFSKDNRTLSTKRGRTYAGQRCDARSATLHFDLYHYAMDEGDMPSYTEEWDFDAEGYSAYIMFRVYDENGYPYYYGDSSSPKFDGYTFQVPYEITTRARSARVEFQLVFTKVPFNGTLQDIDATEYLLSAVSGFAVKDEGFRPPMPPHGPRACAPPSPVACEPSVGGWIEMWKDASVLLPVDLRGRLNRPGLEMTFTTYRGQSQMLDLNVATLDANDQIPVSVIPTGADEGKIPVLKENLGDGDILSYSAKAKGIVGRTAVSKAQELEFNRDEVPLASAIPTKLRLRNSDGQSYVLQLCDMDTNVVSELDMPIEDVVKEAYYSDGYIHLIINTPGAEDGPTKDISFSVTDLLPLYVPGDDYIEISKDRVDSEGKTTYTVKLTKKFWDTVTAKDDAIKTILRKDLAAEASTREAEDTKLSNRIDALAESAEGSDASIREDLRKESDQRAASDAYLKGLIKNNANDIQGLSGRTDILDEEVRLLPYRFKAGNAIDLKQTIDEKSQKITQVIISAQVDAELNHSSSNPVQNSAVTSELDAKQGKLKSSSTVRVEKDVDGLYYLTAATQVKVDSSVTADSTNPVQSKGVYEALEKKQDKLSVDGEFLDWDGTRLALSLDRLVDESLSPTSERPVQNKVVEKAISDLKTLKAAIPVWAESGVEYNSGDIVLYQGALYLCIADAPLTNHEPPTNKECWSPLIHSGAAAVQAVNRPTYICQFGNDKDTEYTIRHGLQCRELVWSIYTADSEHLYVNAIVSAPTINSLRIRLTEPPGTNGMVISIMRVREAATNVAVTGPINVDVTTPAVKWVFDSNDSGMPMYVQAVSDDNGTITDIVGDVIQNSSTAFNPVTIGFQEPRSGTLILAPATACFDMDGITMVLDKADASNKLKDGTWYLVQCFKDGEGESILDVRQDEHTVTIVTGGESWQGLVCLFEATATKEFSDVSELSYQHNKGRYVGVQSYGADGLMGADYNYTGLNVVKADFKKAQTGTLLIL